MTPLTDEEIDILSVQALNADFHCAALLLRALKEIDVLRAKQKPMLLSAADYARVKHGLERQAVYLDNVMIPGGSVRDADAQGSDPREVLRVFEEVEYLRAMKGEGMSDKYTIEGYYDENYEYEWFVMCEGKRLIKYEVDLLEECEAVCSLLNTEYTRWQSEILGIKPKEVAT